MTLLTWRRILLSVAELRRREGRVGPVAGINEALHEEYGYTLKAGKCIETTQFDA
jgi:hypothetical protein